MEVKNIIENACVFLQKEELIKLNIFAVENGEKPSQSQSLDLDRLVRCLNLVLTELAAEYFPIIDIKVFNTSDGIISFSEFDRKLINIENITGESGKPCKYKMFSDKLITSSGNVKVSFSYLPDEVSLEDNFIYYDHKLSQTIITYGVIMEYAYISGMFDDAVMWEKRYKDSLLAVSRKKGEIIWKKRRWL